MPDKPAHRVAAAARESRKGDQRETIAALAFRLIEFPQLASHEDVLRLAEWVRQARRAT